MLKGNVVPSCTQEDEKCKYFKRYKSNTYEGSQVVVYATCAHKYRTLPFNQLNLRNCCRYKNLKKNERGH